jgi:hypothetical protein
MGELIINLAITVLAIIGGLYALGLIIVAIIGPAQDECDCGCGNTMPMDICSSECDADCAANEHYPGQDWRR